MKYWYESHLDGSIYSSDTKIPAKRLFCEQCGDCDLYLGRFETEEEAKKESLRFWGLDDESDND